MRLNVCFNEMAPFGPFAVFIKGRSTYGRMAKIEVNPQEEMANPQDMKEFAVKRHGSLKISCIFVLCVECSRRHSYLSRIVRLCMGSATVAGTGRDSVLQVYVLLS